MFGLCLIPLGIAFLVLPILCERCAIGTARQSHDRVSESAERQGRLVVHVFFYSVTFGGFSGLASSLTIYFNTQYGLSPVTAGYFTAACVFAGSLVRPMGGRIADRIGGIKTLSIMYALAAVFLFIASIGLQSAVAAVVVFLCWRCWRWAPATARCFSWCHNVSARKSA
ncbi:nitrate/nitrite transporter [Undibacterium arcticum]